MIIITGASSAIGQHLLNSYITNTNYVIGTYNTRLPTINSSYNFYVEEETNNQIKFTKLDLRNEHEINDFCDYLVSDKDEVHCRRRDISGGITFIHCAGISINRYLTKMTAEEWDEVFDINVKSAFLITKKLIPVMRQMNYGRIVFISSVVPQIGIPGTSSYATSKSALWGLTKTIAKENADKDITCNCINLGYMDGGMTFNQLNEQQRKNVIDSIPMKKLGHLDNVSHAVNFLMKSDYVTGTQINVNGGLF